MKSAAFTIKVFGAYITLTGIALMLVPNLLLGPLGFAETKEIWIRVVGVLAAVLGYYYWACGAAGARAFFAASVYGRVFFCAACVALVALAGAPWMLVLFGAADVAGAAWTSMAMRRESASSASSG